MCLLAAILAVTAFFNNRPVDIHLHDTYFVLTSGLLQLPFALLFGIEALIYHLIRKRYNIIWMKAIHVLSCWLFIMFIFWLPDVFATHSIHTSTPRRYYDYSPRIATIIRESGFTGILSLVLVVGQLLFIIHTALSISLSRR